MLYFIPDWEDRVDPNFDFNNDFTPLKKKLDPYNSTVYAHEIFPEPPYDGILVSLSVFKQKIRISETNGQSPKIRTSSSIKDYLRIKSCNKPLKIMGDCGAFSYINELKPPYSTEWVANLYNSLGFDSGISVDHLIVDKITINQNGKEETHKLTKKEKEVRRQVSIENAEKFLRYHKENNCKFTPIGSAQGDSIKDYLDSVKKLIEMGYDYVALGGLVPRQSDYILKLVQSVSKLLKTTNKSVKLHLLGLLRQNLLPSFRDLGVYSFDSASYLRKAWLRSGMNYLGTDGSWYAAVRVPCSWDSRISKKAIELGITQTQLEKQEKEALEALRAYANRTCNIEDTLEVVMKHDVMLTRNGSSENNLQEKYRRTLESRIWEKCGCEICRNIGINVVIFRGANRNKRRGFHNTNIFYKNFF